MGLKYLLLKKISFTIFVPDTLIRLAVGNAVSYYPVKRDISSHETVLYEMALKTWVRPFHFSLVNSQLFVGDFFFFFFFNFKGGTSKEL